MATRSSGLVAIVAIVILALPVPGIANHCEATAGGLGSALDVVGECEDHHGRGSGGGSAPRPEDVAYEPVWGTQANGEPCIRWRVHVFTGAASSNAAWQWEQLALRMVSDARLQGVTSRWCQGAVGTAVAARAFVASIPLPEPTLDVAPGYAVTGMDAYLVIDGQESWIENGTVTFSDGSTAPIRIVFTPYEHVVDWDGDGPLEPETHTTTGVPHPGGAGEIVHVYADAGARTITSLHRWRADWEVLGVTGTVDPIEIGGSLDLDVEQIQAVRDR